MKTFALAFVAIVLLPSSVFSQPIEISTPDELQAIGADDTSLAGDYILVNDIDLAGYPWKSIFGFSGMFDGNGHIVKNLTTNNTENRAGGLFGKALAGSVIKNVGVVDCNITSGWYPGAVVGDCFGEVYNCFAAGGTVTSILDTGNIGSFCGMVRPSGSVTNCYSTVDITFGDAAWANQGGFVGHVAGPVTNCYYAGVVTVGGDQGAGGGFFGNGVGPRTSCYFDVEVGGVTTTNSSGGTNWSGTVTYEGRRITDDMMQEATYVGWDFSNVWAIDEGQSYPQLRMFLPPNPKATGPMPRDGGVIEATFVELAWTVGAGATTHTVYVSDDADAVAQGTVEAVQTTEISLVVGVADAPLGPSLTPGMTYYWRVDAVGDETTVGDVWSFSVAPQTAYDPSPADGARVMDLNVVLSWKAGLGTIAGVYYVTVGESFDEVDAAEPGLGTEVGETTLDIGPQEPGKIIYWRVDGLSEETGEFVQGPVWSFATASLVIDDFEIYNDDPDDPAAISIFDVWLDGWDETLGNGTGAVVSNEVPPYAEQFVVHSGSQAMPFWFDNSGQTLVGARALYSETSRTFTPARDWSGDTVLAVWYRGRSQNAVETLSIVITDAAGSDSKPVKNEDAVQSRKWTEWAISLSDIEGVDLGQVKALAIRIGDPDAQQAGSEGKIYIDDIAIYPQQLVSSIPIPITVANGHFEEVYKPGSDTITADLGGGWTQGLGSDAPMDDGTATYSDGTTGDAVDIPGWIGADAQGWIDNGGTYGRDTSFPNRQGSVARQIVTPDGLYYYLSNGGDWGNPAGGLIVSDASLGNVEDGTYTLSMLATGPDGPATPVVLELLADGVALAPSSSVDPELSGDWQEFSRTYDAASLAGHIGASLTIRLGVGRGASGGQTCLDAVSLYYAP